jgi:putative transposase
MENTLVQTLKTTGGMSQRKALERIGLSRSGWQYRHNPRPKTSAPVPQKERAYPNRIDEDAAARIHALITAAWEQDHSVGWAFATAWDGGVMLASERTWWRLANTLDDQQQRPLIPTRTSNRTKRPAPQVLATRPGQVWVWDITDLPTPFRKIAFKAYVIQDLYSRKIVGYRIEDREVDALAVQMFTTAFVEHGVPETVHSDSGPAMRSNDLHTLLTDNDVTHSFSRPRVSNDNAHKESEFRTAKHRPDYPGVFDDLAHARTWFAGYVHWYNTDHHHTGIALFTPDQVHNGTWRTLHTLREQTLTAYYHAHPERFRHQPHTKTPDDVVGINPPKKQAA